MPLRLVLAALALLISSVAPLRAEPTTESKAAIEQIVRDYLLAHPEVIEEALRAGSTAGTNVMRRRQFHLA